MSDKPADTKTSSTPPWEAKRPPVRRGLVRKVITLLLIAGAIGFLASSLRSRPVEVETVIVKSGPLTVFVSEEGRTRVRNRYNVAAPVAGSMQRISLKAGDPVKAGETVIMRLEPALAPLLDERSRAQARARVSAADAGRKRALEAVEMSRTALKFAQTNWDRVQTTTERGTISASDRDSFEREAQLRMGEVRTAEFAVQVAEFEHAQAQAALLQIDKPTEDAALLEIKSPVSGVVLRVIQESATVTAPGTPIIELGDLTDLEVEAEILSRDAVGITPGMPVSIEQWGGSVALKGRVRRVEPAAFTKISALGVEEQRVLVLCDLDGADAAAMKPLGDRFRVEMRVAVWSSDSTLLVPAGALFREGTDWKSYLYDKGKARAVRVEAGRTDGRLTQVLGGLKDGSEVLLHPPDTVADGIAVVKRDHREEK